MNGVTFGSSHSYEDLSLILSSKTIEAPSPKVETVDLPGGDGVIDLSEYFGEIKYKNRKLSFVFTDTVPRAEFLEHFSSIQNELHGKKVRIILDEDADFYYFGRLTISQWKVNKNIGSFVIDADCEPYKYKLYETTVSATIVSSGSISCSNLRKSVTPTIVLTADAQLTFGGVTYSLSAGTYTAPEIVFTAGTNTILVTGNTTVTITYQEGGL